MNRYKLRNPCGCLDPFRPALMDQGYTWEEAEGIISHYAEEHNDAERDQQLLEEYERAEYDKQLDNFSRS